MCTYIADRGVGRNGLSLLLTKTCHKFSGCIRHLIGRTKKWPIISLIVLVNRVARCYNAKKRPTFKITCDTSAFSSRGSLFRSYHEAITMRLFCKKRYEHQANHPKPDLYLPPRITSSHLFCSFPTVPLFLCVSPKQKIFFS